MQKGGKVFRLVNSDIIRKLGWRKEMKTESHTHSSSGEKIC